MSHVKPIRPLLRYKVPAPKAVSVAPQWSTCQGRTQEEEGPSCESGKHTSSRQEGQVGRDQGGRSAGTSRGAHRTALCATRNPARSVDSLSTILIYCRLQGNKRRGRGSAPVAASEGKNCSDTPHARHVHSPHATRGGKRLPLGSRSARCRQASAAPASGLSAVAEDL